MTHLTGDCTFFFYVISVQAIVQLDLRAKIAHYAEAIVALDTGYINLAQTVGKKVKSAMLLSLFYISLCTMHQDSRMCTHSPEGTNLIHILFSVTDLVNLVNHSALGRTKLGNFRGCINRKWVMQCQVYLTLKLDFSLSPFPLLLLFLNRKAAILTLNSTYFG